MQLRVVEDGAWEISKVSEIEYLFLNRVASAANADGCEAARDRMFPEGALVEGSSADDSGSKQDWKDFVIPDLENSFRDAVEVVSADVSSAEKGSEGSDEGTYKIRVPSENTEHWYSALNQARLVLAARYELPISEADMIDGESVDERWIALAQSDLYAFIQSFLLETVLRLP